MPELYHEAICNYCGVHCDIFPKILILIHQYHPWSFRFHSSLFDKNAYVQNGFYGYTKKYF